MTETGEDSGDGAMMMETGEEGRSVVVELWREMLTNAADLGLEGSLRRQWRGAAPVLLRCARGRPRSFSAGSSRKMKVR